MNLVEIFKAMGDENRLKIIQMLKVGELCVCEIIDELKHLTQPAISHHLKILKQAGLVKDRRAGKWIYYSLNKVALLEVKDLYEELMAPMLFDNPFGNRKRPNCEDCS